MILLIQDACSGRTMPQKHDRSTRYHACWISVLLSMHSDISPYRATFRNRLPLQERE